MAFDKDDDGEDGENNGVGFVEVSKMSVKQVSLFLGNDNIWQSIVARVNVTQGSFKTCVMLRQVACSVGLIVMSSMCQTPVA